MGGSGASCRRALPVSQQARRYASFTSFYAVFKAKQGWRTSLPKFLLSLCVQAASNTAIVSACMAAGASVWVAQVASTGLMTVLNFVMYRVWVFR